MTQIAAAAPNAATDPRIDPQLRSKPGMPLDQSHETTIPRPQTHTALFTG